MPSLFHKDIYLLKGVGEKRATQFKKIGINSIGSLFYYFPKDYENLTEVFSISSAPTKKPCCIKGTVTSPISESVLRKGMTIYKTKISDGFSSLSLIFFNCKYTAQKLKKNGEYYFWGKISETNNHRTMSSPKIYSKSEINSLKPLYSQVENLSSKQIESAMRQAFLLLPENIPDTIPEKIREKYNLCELKFALRNIHFPENYKDIEKARRRLLFEDLLNLQLSLSKLKIDSKKANSFKLSKNYSSEFFSILPFKLTPAQIKVIDDCVKDMCSQFVMNRLIQGDVGSGKTVVAAALCYNAIKEKSQCAFMAPTEILAQQHYLYLYNLLSQAGMRVEILCGSTPTSQKKRIKESLRLGLIDLIIGTHALLTDDVEFANLGLVITDEQHRFGVRQRNALAAKGAFPHTIVMSATPIPRTLALIVYGDLDISVIDEMPKSRQKIDTFLISSEKRNRAIDFIKKEIENGHQAYIVCPLVEESEKLQLESATKYVEKLKENPTLKNCSIGLLHGKMKSYEKNDIMQQFVMKEIDILVSTTVVEVGIDVKNATVMMIENAERLGLSQLHQLRGRVGRDKFKSYCILVSDRLDDENIKKRLEVIVQNDNGFEIADNDLKLRGPGDFLGTRQHGFLNLKTADFLDDLNIISEVKSAVVEILKDDPQLNKEENRFLKAKIKNFYNLN